MADEQQTSTSTSTSATDIVKQLFSPTTLAALRYALTALAPVLALFGFTGLTPAAIDQWVQYAQTFGVAALAIMALLGIALPLTVAVFGILSSTVKKQIARVRELADNPQLASQEAQKALVEATAQIAKAPAGGEAIAALVKATKDLPGVSNVTVNGNAAPELAQMAVNPNVDKVSAAPGQASVVSARAASQP